MSDYCLNCSGLILEPNKLYGYAGKICYCQKPPQFCKPASQELTTGNIGSFRQISETEYQMRWQIQELEQKLAEANALLRECIDQYGLPIGTNERIKKHLGLT